MSAASESAVPDVLGPGVRVVFCGINPGRVSAAAGAAFANPRNDFWRLLHAAGFTPRVLAPEEQHELLSYGVGLTNAARRTTRGSGDLRRTDFSGAAERVEEIARTFRPRAVGFVGKTAYTGTFGERCEHGLQKRQLGHAPDRGSAGADPRSRRTPEGRRLRHRRRSRLSVHQRQTALYVLPSTSPANAAVAWEERLRWFRALREFVG